MTASARLLQVDLAKQTWSVAELTTAMQADTVGGVGLGAQLLLDNFSSTTTWDAPENPLMLLGGPLSGTRVAGSGTFCVVTQGAMTGLAASSQANGYLGVFLRTNGYLGLYITGQSTAWVYLLIRDGRLEFRPASHLLGLDTMELQEAIRTEVGEPRPRLSVYGIGPAGENLVRFAAIVGDYGHVAAHNGVGAVMGSKRVKAVVVVRGQEKLPVADPEGLSQKATELYSYARGGVYEK